MTQLKATFKWVGNLLNRLEEAFLCTMLLSMIILACLQIILRDLFSEGFVWADPLLRYMVIWAGLLGADVATRKGKHIAIDIISHMAPPKIEPWLAVVIHFFSASVCIALTYAAIIFVQNEATFDGGRTILGIPAWAMNLVFPLAFCLMALRFMGFFSSSLFNIVKKSGQPGLD